MAKQKHINISERLVLLRLFDVLFPIMALYLLSVSFDVHYLLKFTNNILSYILTLTIYLWFFGQIFEMYKLKVASDGFQVIRSVFLTTLITTVFFVFTPIISPQLPEKRLDILYLYLGLFISILTWRFLYIWLIFTPKYFKDILILGDSKSASRVIDLVLSKAPENHIVGYYSDHKIKKYTDIPFFDKKNKDLKKIVNLHSVTEIIVADRINFEKSNQINKRLVELFENGISIKNIENYYEEVMSCVPRRHLTEDFYKNISFSKSNENRVYLALVRFIDIISAILGLICLTILLPLILVGNILANRGKLLYKQERIGLKGKKFDIFKFRTMVKDAEKHGAVWASKKDDRVTPFGKILRKLRIDEMPQFYNILKGQMSLIGPRPERPEFVKDLSKNIPLYEIRHVIKPGLTGWAQVMYPYASTVEEQHKKLRYDLYYIKNRSFYLDFKIIINTISTILFMRGN